MRGEEQRMRTDSRLGSLAEGISVLAKQLSAQAHSTHGGGTIDGAVLERIAQGQDEATKLQTRMLEVLSETKTDTGENVDAETRMRLRNIDVQLLRVLEEMSAGRQDSIAEIRQDLATLIYTLQQAVTQDEG